MKPNENSPFAIEASLAFVRLTRDVARKLEEEFSDHVSSTMIVIAQTEAEEIAQATGIPHLILPVLAEEKVRHISKQFVNELFTTPLAA